MDELNQMEVDVLRTVCNALLAAIGEKLQQGAERRTYEVFVMPEYRDAHGKTVDHPNALFVVDAKTGRRKFCGGSKMHGTGPGGGECIDLFIGRWTALPDNKGGRFLLDYLTTDPEESLRVKVRSFPSIAEKSYDVASNSAIDHMTAEQHRDAVAAETELGFDDWKKRLEPAKPRAKKSRKAA